MLHLRLSANVFEDVGALHVAPVNIYIHLHLAKLFKESYVFKLSLYVDICMSPKTIYLIFFTAPSTWPYGRKGVLTVVKMLLFDNVLSVK